ncbi:MAG: EamA family transporter [Micrococcales bacterium]
MLAVILGFATSLTYGFADFFGAIAAKKLRPIFVTAFAAYFGLGLLVTLVISGAFTADFSEQAFFWGILGGLFSAAAMTCLYASLAIGPISILSPLGAVISAIVPSIVGVIRGDSFSALGWVAILLILIAVIFVGFIPGEKIVRPSTKGLVLGASAGVGIGAVLICLNVAPAAAGLAPVIMLRVTNATLLTGFAVSLFLRRKAKGAELRLGAKTWVNIAIAGFCDAGANVLFVLASRQGNLTLVAVLTALYPLGTILLARLVLKEKIALIQLVGILLALAASALLAIG